MLDSPHNLSDPLFIILGYLLENLLGLAIAIKSWIGIISSQNIDYIILNSDQGLTAWWGNLTYKSNNIYDLKRARTPRMRSINVRKVMCIINL